LDVGMHVGVNLIGDAVVIGATHEQLAVVHMFKIQ
jgi:hypothetical protein